MVGVPHLPMRRWRAGGETAGERAIARETPVAIVHDGSTTAVMMASPADLEDFAVGFSLTERVIGAVGDITGLEIVLTDQGIEARIWLGGDRSAALAGRRRRLAGATGCGLCGIESLAEAVRPPPKVSGERRFAPGQVIAAMADLAGHQPLGNQTRAMHAAALWRPDEGVIVAREDVGRHNALDKLAGALARAAIPTDGLILLTSRVSVEMVQKAAAIGSGALAAVSAPTDLAIRIAEDAGLTLIAVAREDGFEVFTHPWRIAAP